jgi:hypothetical protein
VNTTHKSCQARYAVSSTRQLAKLSLIRNQGEPRPASRLSLGEQENLGTMAARFGSDGQRINN